ncbi:hypothetical protein BMS3Bbin06_00432 [bacterium BMS3Bbin06]|nr:hypothetical protein BMS3Bbin06_00432 [bacterium BMS3Bbin06]
MVKATLTAALKIKGGATPVTRKELKGEKTKDEIELLSLLTKWHNNAKKKKDFSGVLR